eukprot:m.5712 g.5712  ORF g.5712 m.5712 type:complete len:323 (-) comp2028_c0_seq1:1423-2391(-)
MRNRSLRPASTLALLFIIIRRASGAGLGRLVLAARIGIAAHHGRHGHAREHSEHPREESAHHGRHSHLGHHLGCCHLGHHRRHCHLGHHGRRCHLGRRRRLSARREDRKALLADVCDEILRCAGRVDDAPVEVVAQVARPDLSQRHPRRAVVRLERRGMALLDGAFRPVRLQPIAPDSRMANGRAALLCGRASGEADEGTELVADVRLGARAVRRKDLVDLRVGRLGRDAAHIHSRRIHANHHRRPALCAKRRGHGARGESMRPRSVGGRAGLRRARLGLGWRRERGRGERLRALLAGRRGGRGREGVAAGWGAGGRERRSA